MTYSTCRHCNTAIYKDWAVHRTVWVADDVSTPWRTICSSNPDGRDHSPDPGVASPRVGPGEATPNQGGTR
jgi:hypothetical protein